jgi:hypothetical protein
MSDIGVKQISWADGIEGRKISITIDGSLGDKYTADGSSKYVYAALKRPRSIATVQHDYDGLLQAFFDEIDYIKRNGTTRQKENMLSEVDAILKGMVNGIVNEYGEKKDSNYLIEQVRTTAYARISLGIAVASAYKNEGNAKAEELYSTAKRLLFALNESGRDRAEGLSELYGEYSEKRFVEASRAVNGASSFAIFNHTRDQQIWFLSMALQLVEEGQMTTADEAKIGAIFTNSANEARAIGDRLARRIPDGKSIINAVNKQRHDDMVEAEDFYKLAAAYFKCRSNSTTGENRYADLYSRVCAAKRETLVINAKGTRQAVREDYDYGSMIYLLRMQILNDAFTLNPASHLDDIRTIVNEFNFGLTTRGHQMPTQADFQNILNRIGDRALDTENRNKAIRNLSDIRLEYNTYVQAYYLNLAYQQTLGDYAALENLTKEQGSFYKQDGSFNESNCSLATRLMNRESSSFARTIAFVRRKIAAMKVDIGGMNTDGSLVNFGRPELTATTPAERQQGYYAQATDLSLQAEEFRRAGLSSQSAIRLSARIDLDKEVLQNLAAVAAGTVARAKSYYTGDNLFAQNVHCDLI